MFDALRRDPRLNGGSNRKWKTEKNRLYEKMVRSDYDINWHGEWTRKYNSENTSESEKELLKLRINLRHAQLLLAANGVIDSLPEKTLRDIWTHSSANGFFKNQNRFVMLLIIAKR